MKIHSLKLTIQDMPDPKNKKLFAAVFGTVVIDTGDIKKDEKGEAVLDAEGEEIKMLEDVQFVFPLNKIPEFKTHIQAMVTEALTLKNIEIAQENGQLSHFLRAMGADAPTPKAPKGFRKGTQMFKRAPKPPKDETEKG